MKKITEEFCNKSSKTSLWTSYPDEENHEKKLANAEKLLRRCENIKFYSFYGRANESMKSEVLLPIETNIPKKLFNEEKSNILHRRKCCRLCLLEKDEKRERNPDFSVPKKDRKKVSSWCGSDNEQQLETLHAYLNNFNDAISGHLFQLWVYYRTSYLFIKTRRKKTKKTRQQDTGKWSQLRN